MPSDAPEPTSEVSRAELEEDEEALGEDATRAEELETVVDKLTDPDLADREKQEVWNELARTGRLDDAIAYFEANVDDNPDDPDAHSLLGHAYTQKIFTVNEAEKMRWAMQAHGSYDQALELDDQHWEARFSKAVSYAFAPPIFGLQPKAIEHFETLRQQQTTQPPQDRFADTYELLGNMYQNSGKAGKAAAVWREGAQLYPDDNSLRDKVRALPPEAPEEAK